MVQYWLEHTLAVEFGTDKPRRSDISKTTLKLSASAN
jgi:hypothetical protein